MQPRERGELGLADGETLGVELGLADGIGQHGCSYCPAALEPMRGPGNHVSAASWASPLVGVELADGIGDRALAD